MKKTLKIAVLCVALVVMGACSTQKRAERRVRRAVELCPELVQVKAHLIDTTLTAPAFADMVAIPSSKVAAYDTVYAATDHGTVVVSLRKSDSALRVGFVAAPQKIHYQDTVRYAQVVVSPSQPEKAERDFFGDFLIGLALVAAGFVLAFHLLFKKRT